MFNSSLKFQIFPSSWKTSFVTPIFKSGKKDCIKNFRPITVLPALPKLFELLLISHLSWHCRNTIVDQQHGFVSGRSTATNLLLYQNDIVRAIEKGLQVDAIYTDFSKAFDRVNHSLLLAKLTAVGFPLWLTNWLHSYLSDRTQIVRIKNHKSFPLPATSGVPQGSHLGPLLFNLFINDIGLVLKHCKFLLFADDLKIYLEIKDRSDCEKLQADLISLHCWSNKNGMSLNLNKCYSISFTRSKNPIIQNYHIGNELSRLNTIRDLGVLFDIKLSFIDHIHAVISRASQTLGFLLRNSKSFSISTLRTLYVSLVQPILQYASPVWNPFYHNHINNIERIQNKFLRHVAFKMRLQYGTYTYMCKF